MLEYFDPNLKIPTNFEECKAISGERGVIGQDENNDGISEKEICGVSIVLEYGPYDKEQANRLIADCKNNLAKDKTKGCDVVFVKSTKPAATKVPNNFDECKNLSGKTYENYYYYEYYTPDQYKNENIESFEDCEITFVEETEANAYRECASRFGPINDRYPGTNGITKACYLSFVKLPQNLTPRNHESVLWTFNKNMQTVNGILNTENNVLVALDYSNPSIAFSGDGQAVGVIALNKKDGSIKWVYWNSSDLDHPVLDQANNQLLLNTGANEYFRLSAIDLDTGITKWVFKDRSFYPSFELVDSSIYIYQRDNNKTIIVNPKSGVKTGEFPYHYVEPPYENDIMERFYSSKLNLNLVRESRRIIAFRNSTGERLWEFSCSPNYCNTFFEDKIFMGRPGAALLMLYFSGNEINAIDTSNGKVIWRFCVKRTFGKSFTVSDDTHFVTELPNHWVAYVDASKIKEGEQVDLFQGTRLGCND